MLSTHIDPFVAFCKDLQIPGCEVHLYKGPNTFGGTFAYDNPFFNALAAADEATWWDTENTYFLAGVRKGLQKRAADSDVLMRNMFTLDFDIRKELEKIKPEGVQYIEHPIYKGGDPMERAVSQMGEHIIGLLEKHHYWKNFRYVVMSGNGMHVHYFGTPVAVNKERWAAGMKIVFANVAEITPIPPDFCCGNAGRIMRMPGSWNVKDPLNKKPVEIVVWNEGVLLPDLDIIMADGQRELDEAKERRSAELKEFETKHPSGESPVIDLINQIPIEQVAAQLFAGIKVRMIKKDGGLRFADEKGIERGFFKHHQYNIIVHEGTSLFPPPVSKGYNCLGLCKVVLGITTPEAVDWFSERSTPVRMARDSEKAAWAAENGRKEILNFEDTLSHTSHV